MFTIAIASGWLNGKVGEAKDFGNTRDPELFCPAAIRPVPLAFNELEQCREVPISSGSTVVRR